MSKTVNYQNAYKQSVQFLSVMKRHQFADQKQYNQFYKYRSLIENQKVLTVSTVTKIMNKIGFEIQFKPK